MPSKKELENRLAKVERILAVLLTECSPVVIAKVVKVAKTADCVQQRDVFLHCETHGRSLNYECQGCGSSVCETYKDAEDCRYCSLPTELPWED